MSRAYRVTVKGAVQRVVHVEDGVCTVLELLPVLPRERTAEILGAELERRGFVREGAVVRRVDEGVTVEIDVTTGEVKVQAEATAEIVIERERTEAVESIERGTKSAQERVDREAERAAAAAESKAQGDVSAKLEKKLRELRGELDAVTGRVTADALKEKARTLGEIEELHEDTETGELTIKVRL